MREFEVHLAARKREATEREEDAAYAKFKRASKSTCMPAIPIFNIIAGNPPPIPVNSYPVFFPVEKALFGPTYLSLANARVAKLNFY